MADPLLDQLFEENFPIIRAKCTRMLGAREEAEDVAQETFVRLCESGAVHYDPVTRLRWIYATSTRLAIDLLRRRRLGVEVRPAAEVAGRDAGPAARDRHPDDVLSARRALAALAAAAPPDELAVALLCRVDGLTQPEAAAVCRVSERTVRRLLGRFDDRCRGLGGRTP